MQSPAARIVLQLTGGLVIVAAAFFATSGIVFYWSSAAEADAGTIQITEATYGKNCEHFQPPPGHANQVRDGNATASAVAACAGAPASCLYVVDSAKLGDPATGCGKDFMMSWRCAADQPVRHFYLPAEADGATALIACRRW